MELTRFKGGKGRRPVRNAEAMLETIRRMGFVPFFVNDIFGFSIEEMTPKECWFNDDTNELGPWDWKIDCIQSGEIAYGKFLSGKASFATVEWYREIMNWRRSRKELSPKGLEKEVYKAIQEAGTITASDLRKNFGVKKSKMDTILTHLEYATLIVIGDITRVYRGPDLHYDGWQRSSVCTPEALFGISPDDPESDIEDDDFENIFIKKKPQARSRRSNAKRAPEESFKRLCAHVEELFPYADDEDVMKLLR